MNIYDWLIIYLACGAPFAVYYFLQNRRVANSNSLWLKTVLVFSFWLPFAMRLLFENRTLRNIFDKQTDSDSTRDKQLAPLRKNLETAIISIIPHKRENILAPTIFEVREILERYTGLTLALQTEPDFSRTDNEFYKISNHKNARLAEICSARRNRQRLFFHQTEARRDFLNLIGIANDKKLFRQTVQFAKLLKDSEAQIALEKLAQTTTPESVKTTENDLWKSATHKPQPINQTASARLNLSPATMNLQSKD